MANQYPISKLVRIRLTELDQATNAAIVGANRGYVTTQMVTAQVSPQTETGEKVVAKTGNGDVCATAKADDTTSSYKITLAMCAKDMNFEYFLRGGNLLQSGGVAYGYDAPIEGTPNTHKTLLEFWCPAWDGNAQAITGITTPNLAYFHFVYGLTSGWVPGDVTYNSGIPTFTFVGDGVRNTALTANGPYNDWPAYVAAEGGIQSGEGYFQDASIPSAVTGYVTTPSGS